jgi:3-oxoacyl-[acyl-carrier-protein] synthase-1
MSRKMMENRVVVTGMGIVSCIGNNRQEVLESLREGRSGIRYVDEYEKLKLRSRVAGLVNVDTASQIERKHLRFMGDASAYAYIALREAMEQAALEEQDVSDPRIGLIAASSSVSCANVLETAELLRQRGVKKVGPYRVPRTMCASVSACLSTAYKIKGINYSISSACATGTHCIGNAVQLIQAGAQDVVFAGGAEDVHWCLTTMFDAMGALSSNHNHTPETASRPYDAKRDGFVIAGGAGMLALESLEHATARKAPILAEVVGFGANSDGDNMVAPSGEGAVRCMQMVLETVDTPIDYINTHGTSTPAGDIVELNAIEKIFGDNMPVISSTKGLTGHSLGATGAQEAVYCLLMLENDFVAASANIESLDPKARGKNIASERVDHAGLNTVMTNNFGFGGTNGCLALRRFN